MPNSKTDTEILMNRINERKNGMKKLLSLLCVLSLSAALLAGCSTAGDAGTSETPGSSSTPSEVTEPGSSQETVDSLDVNVMALKGPTAMGMVKMMADSEPVEEFTDQLKEEYENVVSSGNIYHFTITSATDEVSAALAQGTTDIAAVPANLASVLYNNTEGGVQVLAINTLGVLYIVESGDTVHSVEDLRGKTIYASGKGNTPEAALNYVLTQNGIDPASDVTIEWKSEQAECLSALMAEENTIAMLPQPFVTSAMSQVEGLRVALDMNEEWQKVAGSKLVTGVLVVRKDAVENDPEAFAAFMDGYAASVEAANNDLEGTAALCEKVGVVAKAAIAKKALPKCNIVYRIGDEMKADVNAYLQVLYDASPAAVGGKLPDGNFYYTKATVAKRVQKAFERLVASVK